MIKIFHNTRCSKSRCALEMLNNSGQDFTIVDYMNDVPSQAELENLLKLLKIPAIDLVRKREVIWKERFKNIAMDENDIIQAMLQYPQLIERPIILGKNQAIIARPPELINEFLAGGTFNNPL